MITASHNPAVDNGYKLYWSNAVQIIPPLDGLIASSIEQQSQHASTEINLDAAHDRTHELKSAYLAAVAAGARFRYESRSSFHITPTNTHSLSCRAENAQTRLRFVYTPMHGVGDAFVKAIWSAFGFPTASLSSVPTQQAPNPDFPTVAFPNPEEPGALVRPIKSNWA